MLPQLHRIRRSRHTVPVLALVALGLAYWGKVLGTGQVLLPGAMLRGFAPFGADPQAPWSILQWDALGQYYPWRLFAARQLHLGLIPLWNPHQFAGTPFLANGQSAVFYPLNLPFWVLDVAYAFGVSALLHTLLAALSTYALAQRWGLSRAASVLAATAFAYCGYLAAWVMLPTLANTASWLPLLLLCLEARTAAALDRPLVVAALPLALALSCALLAGHAQIFFYLVVALLLRAVHLRNRLRACGVLIVASAGCLGLSAMQLLPTLELARLGHRAAGGPATMAGWSGVAARALQIMDLPGLLLPNWPSQWGSASENFAYVGVTVALLVIVAVATARGRGRESAGGLVYALGLALFGLLYGLATPLAMLFYFTVPGIAQMGGVGRALLLWSLGAALTAGYGLDALRRRWPGALLPALALMCVTLELGATGWAQHSIAPRSSIYPDTPLTTWLRSHTGDGGRVLCVTPHGGWQPAELLQPQGRNHPPGVLPPNGATVYGLNDVSGYDSLAPRAYREYVAQWETRGEVSPQWNGNMVLLNSVNSPALDSLGVRYVVSQTPLDIRGRKVFEADGCIVYEVSPHRTISHNGVDFYPGWRGGKFQPESFRFGGFVTLCTLAAMALIVTGHVRKTTHDR